MKLMSMCNRTFARRALFMRYNSTATRSHADVKDLIGSAGAHIALRDACRCPQCVDQSTKQRDFHFAHIPSTIQGEVQKDAEGNFKVRWTDDVPGFKDHVSTFTPADVRRVQTLPRQEHQTPLKVWSKSIFKAESSIVPYDDFMDTDIGLARVIHQLTRYGLVFLRNVPMEDSSVTTVAKRIAPLRNTFYGEHWNVKSIPQAINVAYTSKDLGFHSDLLYLKETPGVQLLHCLENTCPGGESRFVDTLKAYDVLCTENPALAEALRRSAVRYEYDNDGSYYTDVKQVVNLKRPFDVPNRKVEGCDNAAVGDVGKIFWSPPFVGSVCTMPGEDPGLTRAKIEASKAFADILERPDLVYETKMEAGTCVIFNNYRVLHARKEFDLNSGSRWLKGCYLDEQDVWSKEVFLANKIQEIDASLTRI